MEKQSPVGEQEESVLARKGQEALDKLYSSALNGIPTVSGSVDDLVEDYLSKYETVEEAAIAAMGGYDVRSDQVKTLVYVCLTGTSIADLLKDVGVKVGEQVARTAIKKIPGAVLTKINQRIGFRFITKFGEKGVVNLGKCVPLVGAVIGGGMDVASTRVIGARAIAEFIA